MSKITSEHAYRSYLLMELLRSTGEKEFPMQLASIFFWIAAHDGCKQEEIAAAVCIAPSTVSRNVTWLGPRHRLEHRQGLRLVRRERDPDNHRAWQLFLTPKGKQFVRLLETQLSMPLGTAIKETAAIKKQIAYDSPDEDDGSSL